MPGRGDRVHRRTDAGAIAIDDTASKVATISTRTADMSTDATTATGPAVQGGNDSQSTRGVHGTDDSQGSDGPAHASDDSQSHSGGSVSTLCADCRTDTTPCTGKPDCRHTGRWEWYICHDALWATAGMTSGFLCIGCLEHRIGRRLRPGDFPAYPVNNPHPWDTTRLSARLRTAPPDQLSAFADRSPAP